MRLPSFKSIMVAGGISVLVLGAMVARVALEQQDNPRAEPGATEPSAPVNPTTEPGSGALAENQDADSGADTIDTGLITAISGFEAAVWSTRYDETAESRSARLAPFIAPVFIDALAPDTGELGATQAQLATTTNQAVVAASVAANSDISVAMLAPSVATATVKVTRHTTDSTGYDATDTITDTVYLRQEDGKWLVRLHTPGQVNDG